MKIKFFALFVVAALMLAASCKKETQLQEEKNDIEDYLQEHGIQAEVNHSVYYVVLEEGTGAQCNPGDAVACKYKVSTMSDPDNIFDQSGKHAFECVLPPQVPSSAGSVIMGFQIALTTMREGGKSIFYIPASYGYGSQPVGPNNEANANLIFEIELCEIVSNGNKH